MQESEKKPTALILMATHNGERFIDKQIESILNQHDVDVHVFVSDDDSSDATSEIIKSMVPSNQLTFVNQVPPLGLPGNFLWLLDKAPSGYDMYAFSDQDDIWEPEKLYQAWTQLRNTPPDQAALWVSRVTLINEDGERGEVFPDRWQRTSFGNALVDSIGPGCAMVWNQAMQQKVRIPAAKDCMMHDSWMYLTATALGQVICEPDPQTRYRIHGRNAVGIKNSVPERLQRYLRGTRGKATSWEIQAAAFSRTYGAVLTVGQLRLAEAISSFRRRTRFNCWLRGDLRRSGLKGNALLLMRLCVRG